MTDRPTHRVVRGQITRSAALSPTGARERYETGDEIAPLDVELRVHADKLERLGPDQTDAPAEEPPETNEDARGEESDGAGGDTPDEQLAAHDPDTGVLVEAPEDALDPRRAVADLMETALGIYELDYNLLQKAAAGDDDIPANLPKGELASELAMAGYSYAALADPDDSVADGL